MSEHNCNIEALLALLQSTDWSVRRKAAAMLGSMRDERILPALRHALADSDELVRVDVVVSLGALHDVRVVELLAGAMRDNDMDVVEAAHHTLIGLGPVAIDPLIQLLADPSSEVRWRAADALGKIGDERALPYLAAMHDHDTEEIWPDTTVAIIAALALSEIRARHVVVHPGSQAGG